MIRNNVEDRMIEMIDRLHGNAEPDPIPGLFATLFEVAQPRARRIVRPKHDAK